MKTLLSIASILILTLAAISTAGYRPDAGDWFTAAMVAALFGFALNDAVRSTRLTRRYL